ncbi:MAG: DNA cytosine methyltransferase [Mycoplasma sp.]
MKKLTYISLFSSAGVGCFGFKLEGFDCVATNELLEKRIMIQKCNKKCRHSSGYIIGSILDNNVKFQINKELNFWKEKYSIENITCLIATPPCQGMSVANHKKNDENQRNSLVVESIKVILEILPDSFVFENVRSFLKTKCTDIDGKIKSIEESIFKNLSTEYKISYKVINFKDYGNNSSRTRTLVIGVRHILNVNPESLFPDEKPSKTIYQLIGNMQRLNQIGEISDNDIFHSFKPYNPIMREWIHYLAEGENAFMNDESKLPHYFRDGKRIYTKNGNSDKYKRQKWNQIAPCVHTRNDILASQNTIHPHDDRVFSVRELMKFMTIPNSFKWVIENETSLNSLTKIEKETFLKKHENLIRASIGEAVPTNIFRQIAKKIKANW